MYLAIAAAILIVMALALTRALLGPTLFDRILAVNTFGTKTVLLITVLGFFTDNASYLDIALVYALINFIGVIAVLRFLEYGTEQDTPPAKRRKTKA
ncbi:MAG TPA: pH regulation protein F [Micavibrio sp.]|nr:pH regulation protein F [Micavibrio sp.]HIL29395.1 pH regulation protein F [Micavibrio sp.]